MIKKWIFPGILKIFSNIEILTKTLITFELKKIMRSSLWHFKAKNRSFNMLKLEVHIFFNSKVIILKKRTTIINPEAVYILVLSTKLYNQGINILFILIKSNFIINLFLVKYW